MANPAPLRPVRRPPPNRLSKKSLNPPAPRPPPNMSPMSPKSPNSMFTPPFQPGGGRNSSPAFQFGPRASYFFRLSGSERTSYASFNSLNFSSADLSPGLT